MNYKEKIQPMDIIIVYNPLSWLHRLIFKVTKARAGHVALYVGDDMIYEATSTGVNRRSTKNYTDRHLIYIARPKQMTEKIEISIRNNCFALESRKYAFLQLLVMLVKYTFRLSKVPDVSKKAMICSEFVAEVFKDAGIPLTGQRPHEVSPADILNSDKVWVIKCQ